MLSNVIYMHPVEWDHSEANPRMTYTFIHSTGCT